MEHSEEPTQEPPSKRRHSEYHDPDYHQPEPPVPQDDPDQKRSKTAEEAAPSFPPSDCKLQRVRELVQAEFQREIAKKVAQLGEIDRRLLLARRLLDQLRYQVVSDYYRQQQVNLNAADVAKVRQPGDSLFGEADAPQMPLHPAIKKIVGKRPLHIPNHLPERTAATMAKESIRLRNPANRRAEKRRQRKIREQGIVTDHSKQPEEQQQPEQPEQQTEPVSPKVTVKLEDEQPCTSRQAKERQLQLNASRLNNKNKFYLVVGNTSKYIGDTERTDNYSSQQQPLVYKWLVYVQGKDFPQPLEAYIKKVRFQLHHSYRPNDIVDVNAPPFQLARRGWGEFPMRIQLFFHDYLHQKPMQLMHNVVLDKTMCGLHTMGAETMVELWLRAEPSFSQPDPLPPAPLSPLESSKPRTISITQNKEDLDDNLFAGISKVELSDIESIEPTVLVTEPLKLRYSPNKLTPARSPLRLNPSPLTVAHLWPVNGQSPKHDFLQESAKVKLEFPSSPTAKPVPNGHHQAKKNVVFQKAGKLYIIDPLQRKLKQQVNQQSLLKPQLSLLKAPLLSRWQMLQCIQHDHGYANMSVEDEESPANLSPIKTQLPKLKHIFSSSQFNSMRGAVEFLLRRLPLAGSQDEEYPFTCATLEAFQQKTAVKQRCYEYLRARFLRRCLMQHMKLQKLDSNGKERYWSLREIVGFSRIHGYTPTLKMLTASEGKDVKRRKEGADDALAQRVQEQLKEEPQPQLSDFCSLSSDKRLEMWIAKHTTRLLGHEPRTRDQEVIDVLGMETVPSSSTEVARRKSRYVSVASNRQMLSLPAPKFLDSAAQLVQDMCKDINISLQPEESLAGVSQPLALTLLSHVLHIFVERLVRRSVAIKLQQESVEKLPLPAANIPTLCLQPLDIGRAIGQCPELDFLGNSHLGVADTEPKT